MTEQHLTNEQLSGYRQETLGLLEMLAADDHIVVCSACQEQLQTGAGLSDPLTLLREAILPRTESPPEHLDYAQIEALADGTLGPVEREIASAHLAVCAACTEEVRDLAIFSAELASSLEAVKPPTAAAREREEERAASPQAAFHNPQPAIRNPQSERPQVINVEGPAQVGYDKAKRRGWWGRFKARLNPQDWSFVEAGALALVAVAAVLGLAWYAQKADRDRKMAQTAPPPMSGSGVQPPILPVTVATPDLGLTPPLPLDPNATPMPPPPVNAPPVAQGGGDIFGGPSLPSAPPPMMTAPLPSAPSNPQVAPNLPSLPVAPTEYVAQLQDGASGIALDKQGNLTGLDGLAPDAQQAVKTALEKQTVEVAPLPPELRGATGTLMGSSRPNEGVPFALSGPVGKVIRTDRPAFSWQRVPNANGYVVTVYDQNFTEVANSGTLTGTSWQSKKAFLRGGVYSWLVKAITLEKEITSPQAPAPAASFKVLEAQYQTILEQARRAYGKSRLVMGIFYARTGLFDEAEQEFNALVKANPNSPAARNLLKELQKARK